MLTGFPSQAVRIVHGAGRRPLGLAFIRVDRQVLTRCFLSVVLLSCASAREIAKADSGTDTGVASSTSQQLPPECVVALRQTADALATARIVASIQREHTMSPGSAPGSRRKDETTVTCFDGGRFYHRSESSIVLPTGEAKASISEMAFDGTTFFVGSLRKNGRSSVVKLLGDNPRGAGVETIAVRSPFLDAAGISVPSTPLAWRSSSIEALPLFYQRTGSVLDVSSDNQGLMVQFEIPDPAVLAARKLDLDREAKNLQAGGSSADDVRQTLEAYQHIRSLEPVRRIQVRMDPDRHFAVTNREERTADGKLIQTFEAEDFAYYDSRDLWMPAKCIMRQYLSAPSLLRGFTAEPYLTVQFHLIELSFEKRDEISFELQYGPGSTVTDHSVAVPATGSQVGATHIVPAAADSRGDAATDGLNDQNTTSSARRTLVILNASVLFVLIGFFVSRRLLRRRR
jgi:hypothetical protein